jgi:hypothetical protein
MASKIAHFPTVRDLDGFRNAQQARATVCRRNIDPPHRRRKIAFRRQPVSELVEVVR